RRGKIDDHAAKTAVANDEVGAAAQHEKFDAVLGATFQNRGQILLRHGLDVNVRRAADAQGGAFGERFIAAHDGFRRNALRQFVGCLFFVKHRFQDRVHRAVSARNSARCSPPQPQPPFAPFNLGFTCSVSCAISFNIVSAICSAASGACHWASADCIFSRTAASAINSQIICAADSGVAAFCSSKRAAPVSAKAFALKNWWLSVAAGNGTNNDGTRIAASSASEDAPERLTATVAAPSARSISPKNGCTVARRFFSAYARRTLSASAGPVRWKNCKSFGAAELLAARSERRALPSLK